MLVDAARLSDGERRILLLLAEGHTVKSIAALDGVSEHSVNERLREARRKTGVASSRELARLLRADAGDHPESQPHKNRDKKIEVAAVAPAAPESPCADRQDVDQQWSKGAIAMTYFVLGGTALAAVLIAGGQHGPTPVATPPLVISTTPAQGAKVAPGRLTISVTFDQAMRAGSYSFVDMGLGRYPDCAPKPRQSSDLRTFTLDCRVESGKSYAIGFNGGRFRNFVGINGMAAQPMLLQFST